MGLKDKQRQLDALNQKWFKKELPLKDAATHPVPGEGNADADVLFIGEAPGKNEDLQGRPFVGAAGKFLDELIASVNLKREDIFIANIIKHRPPNNRDPLPNEVEAYTPWLEEQIEIIDPKLIVALGKYAMEYMLGTQTFTISAIHGQPKRRGGRVIMPVYHPAAALYRHDWKPILMADFAKIPKILELIEQGKDSTKESLETDQEQAKESQEAQSALL